MPYIFSAAWDWQQKLRAKNILTLGMKNELSTSKIVSQLAAEGLSYRRINMLHDIRRSKAVETAKTPAAMSRAETWFDKVYEPFRKASGLNSREASDLWHRTRTESWETIEDAEEGVKWWEIYETQF